MNTENIIQGRVEDGKLILALAGTIDSSNASAVEKAMLPCTGNTPWKRCCWTATS